MNVWEKFGLFLFILMGFSRAIHRVPENVGGKILIVFLATLGSLLFIFGGLEETKKWIKSLVG